jgi:hypothetical protein
VFQTSNHRYISFEKRGGGPSVSDVPPLLHMTQHTALLKIAMKAGEDPGIKVRGASLFAAGSMRPQ